jgi:hypothetical protein
MDTLNPIKTPAAFSCRLQQLNAPIRYALAATFIAAAVAYAAILICAYLHLTPPSSLAPHPRDFAAILFDQQEPISRIQRLLESTDGEMNRGGTMRPAFTDQSLNWESLTQNLTEAEKATLLAQREAERLALLDWARSGAPRAAYENDDYELSDSSVARQITPDYLIHENDMATTRVRLTTLIADRCVCCHGENGRHDTARFIALDAYDRLAPHLQPEITTNPGRPWLLVVLLGLYPLAALCTPLFLLTNHFPATKRFALAATCVALAVLTGCWLAAKPNSNFIFPLLACAAIAALSITVQSIATLAELLRNR